MGGGDLGGLMPRLKKRFLTRYIAVLIKILFKIICIFNKALKHCKKLNSFSFKIERYL